MRGAVVRLQRSADAVKCNCCTQKKRRAQGVDPCPVEYKATAFPFGLARIDEVKIPNKQTSASICGKTAAMMDAGLSVVVAFGACAVLSYLGARVRWCWCCCCHRMPSAHVDGGTAELLPQTVA